VIGRNGGLIGRANPATVGATRGVWTLNEQAEARRQGIWPTNIANRYWRIDGWANTALNSDTLDLTEILFWDNGVLVTSGITCTSNMTFAIGGPGGLVDGTSADSNRTTVFSWATARLTGRLDFDFGQVRLITHIEIRSIFTQPRFPESFVLSSSNANGSGYSQVAIVSTPTNSFTAFTTNVVSTGRLAVSYQADPLYSSVAWLCHFNGLSASSALVDMSSFRRAMTRTGNGLVSNAQSRFDGTSFRFDSTDASADAVTTSRVGNITVTTGADFTIELWVFQLSTIDQCLVSDTGAGQNTQIFRLNEGGVGTITIISDGNRHVDNVATGMIANIWYHLALCRSSGQTRLFVNGTQVGSTITNFIASFSPNAFGAGHNNGAIILGSHCHIDEFRVTMAARYTANFTPQTQAFPDR
jgi:hypothetical protein